jgi:ribosomal protein S18 acetylase RimI-like enzyme
MAGALIDKVAGRDRANQPELPDSRDSSRSAQGQQFWQHDRRSECGPSGCGRTHMPELIYPAKTPGDYEAFAVLVSEYVGWCRTRYQHDAWFVEQVFGYQDLDQELSELATAYGPPNGKTLLARCDDQICGGGAFRRLQDGTCEMKRLYVSDRFKGRGIGRRLADELINTARSEGYPLMRLDTGNLLTEAITMYRKLGFRDCAPHLDYPEKLLPRLVFMELPLSN